MRLRTIHKALIISYVVLYSISVIIILRLGYPLWIALVWNLLTFIGADFPVDFTIPDLSNPFAYLSNIFGVIGNLILVILLTSFFYQLLSKINIREEVVKNKVKKLRNHIIVTPANSIAFEMAQELKRNKIEFVVLDSSKKSVENYINEKMLALAGENTDALSLKNAGIEHAAALILLNDESIKNALAAITAKRINKKVRIASRIKRLDELAKMKRIGINYLIMPEMAVGDEISNFILKHVRG
ncbi:MAG: potassium channel family protein [Candidatus Micrarchaeia archaeon]